MKRGIWISFIPGIVALSASLTLLLILSNWTYFLLLKWHPVWWLLGLYAFSLVCFFIFSKWVATSFEALKEREQKAFIIVLGIYSLFVFLNQYPEYQSTFTTWAMLILAGAAAISIVTSIEQAKKNERIRINERRENERLRKEDREENRLWIEEERGHTLRKTVLDQIEDWAEEVAGYCFSLEFPEELQTLFGMADKIIEFRRRGVGLRIKASIFGTTLTTPLIDTLAKLGEFTEFIADLRNQILNLVPEGTNVREYSKTFMQTTNRDDFGLNPGSKQDNAFSAASDLLEVIIQLRIEEKL